MPEVMVSTISAGSYLVIGGQNDVLFQILEKIPLQANPSDPDIIRISGEGSIGIAEIRELQHHLNRKPVSKPQKIAFIENADTLTVEAQNALLKTLEDPPGSALIFLSCQSTSDNLLPTILSRCQTIYLPPATPTIPSSEIAAVQDLLVSLSRWGIGERFKLAAEVSSSRKEALIWLDKMLCALHHLAISQTSVPVNWPSRTKSLLQAKNRLKANCNVRLTLENLLLN